MSYVKAITSIRRVGFLSGSRIPGIFRKSRKIPIVKKSWKPKIFLIFFGSISNFHLNFKSLSRKNKSRSPEFWDFRDFFGVFSGFFRDFFGISKSQSRSPEFWDFRDFFGVFSGFFRDFFGISKSQSRSPGFRNFRDFSLVIFSGF